jgi:hypothetical protein
MAGDHGVGDPPSGLCPVLYRIGKRPFKGMRLQSNYASGSRGNAPKPGNLLCGTENHKKHTLRKTRRDIVGQPHRVLLRRFGACPSPLHCARRHTSEKRYDSSARNMVSQQDLCQSQRCSVRIPCPGTRSVRYGTNARPSPRSALLQECPVPGARPDDPTCDPSRLDIYR